MKRVYEKPMLYAESYELAEHVAKGCALDGMNTPTHRSIESCGFKVNGGGAVAFQTKSVCTGWWDDFWDQPIDDIFCYNTFRDTSAMFAS